MSVALGRQGQLYVVDESTYGTTPTLLATHALRHLTFTAPHNNFNRETIPEKKASPGHSASSRADRRKSASYSIEALLRPSGSSGVVPELDKVLTAGFGSRSVPTPLSTTFTGAGTTTGGTVASATGLAIGQGVLITCPDGKNRVRILTTGTTGTTLVWEPALPVGQNPANGAALKSCVTYIYTSALTSSLSMAHYMSKSDGSAGRTRVVRGAVVDRLSLDFDNNAEPRLSASGPAKQVDDAPSKPGAFTTVGGKPPSGIVGEVLLNGTAFRFMRLGVEITNGMFLRNDEYGVDAATEAFRGGDRRDTTISMESRTEDDLLWDIAQAGDYVTLLKQTGFTAGNIVAVWAPKIEFRMPDVDDPNGIVTDSYEGMALETADGANDEFKLILA